MDDSGFWGRVKALIKEHGSKQDEVAVIAGINRDTIKQQIHYKRLPDVVQGQKIAAFLGTTVEYLVNGKKTEENIEISTRAMKTMQNYEKLSNHCKDLVDSSIEQFLIAGTSKAGEVPRRRKGA